MSRATTMVLILTLFSAVAVHSQPFDTSDYLISKGGVSELVSMGLECPYNIGAGKEENHVVRLAIAKYFGAGTLGARDTMAAMGNFEWATRIAQGKYRGYSLHVEDVDRDQVCEILMTYNDSAAGGPNIRIAAFKPDPATLQVPGQAAMKDSGTITLNSPAINPNRPDHQMDMADFDGDGRKDIALSYWSRVGASGPAFVHAKLLSVSDSLAFAPITQVDGPAPLMTGIPSGREGESVVCVTAATDIDGDGRANLIMLANKALSDSVWGVEATSYSYDLIGDSMVVDDRSILYRGSRRTDSLYILRATAGCFFDTARGAVVVSISSLRRADTLIALTMSHDTIAHAGITIGYDTLYPPRLASAEDIDGDRMLELWFSRTEVEPCHIARLKADLSLVAAGVVDDRIVGYLAGAAPIIPPAVDSSQTHEMFSYYSYFNSLDDYGTRCRLSRVRCGAGGSVIGIDSLSDMRLPISAMGFRLGDLDGNVRLGTPRQFEVTDIVQPLVILNAPPIHFDIFDTNPYDVSLAYNNNQCQFSANYTKRSTLTTEVQATFNKDWGVSASLSTDHSFWVASVKSHFTAKYGEKFSRETNSSKTVTVQVSSDAVEDDRIYAATLSYKVWEYPVYINGRKKGQIVVVDPAIAENRWFPSKSWSGYSYQPVHEVGNILSYREYADFTQNPLLSESIKGDATSSFVLDANSSHDWSLGFTDFSSSSASTQKQWGLEMGASVEAWGVELAVEGTYNSEELSVQSTSVSSDLQMSVHLDALDMSLGEVSYRVTPYAYWSGNGALVVDYAAMPEVSVSGGTPTWWQQHYGSKADPSFILPWRYDPEKGFALQDQNKRQQTKDIQFFPRTVTAGDTVRITARVHNFSLMRAPSPTTVRFYVGDPDSGGILLVNTRGVDSVQTPVFLAARGMQTVTFDWVVPATVPAYPRIYAVLDPGNGLAEIHETNNKGWNILAKTDGVVVGARANAPRLVATTFGLRTAGVSPGMVGFSIPERCAVTLELYDLSGRRVAVLARGTYGAGIHAVPTPASTAAGMYLCRMVARIPGKEPFIATRALRSVR